MSAEWNERWLAGRQGVLLLLASPQNKEHIFSEHVRKNALFLISPASVNLHFFAIFSYSLSTLFS
jgi:hypothetical protein